MSKIMYSSYHPHYHAMQVMIPCSCFIMMCTMYVLFCCTHVGAARPCVHTCASPFCSDAHQGRKTFRSPVLTPVFCAMGDAQVTSRSGSELQMSPPMEATSPSEVEEGERPKCPGHGCGRGTGRGHTASSSTHPGPQRSINKSRGQGKRPKAIQHNTSLSWLH